METKTLSIIGLVFSFIFPIVGIIISAICLNRYKTEGVTEGKGLAVAGLIIGIAVMVISIIAGACIGCAGVLVAAGSYY